MQITITQAQFETLCAQARAELPQECCGLLGGERTEAGVVVYQLYPLRNLDHSSEHFSMDPAEQFAAVKAMRDCGWELVGNYHSHPTTAARPSAEDRRLALDQTLYYLILSLAEPDRPVLKAFAYQGEVLTEVALVVLAGGESRVGGETKETGAKKEMTVKLPAQEAVEPAVRAELDITDVVCPLTFVRTKVALEELNPGEVLTVRLNAGEPIQNVPASLKEEGHKVLRVMANTDGTFTLWVKKGGFRG